MSIWAPLLALIAAPPAGQDAPAAPVQVVPDTPEMAQARANHTRIQTPPALLSPRQPDAPAAARAAGAHGKVVVTGIIGSDGSVTQARIVTSSRSDLLDAAALDRVRAGRFAPARDADGNAIAVVGSFPFQFSNTDLPGRNFDVLLRYRCDQFVRDQDWWGATWPATARDELYTMTLGLKTIAGGFKADSGDFSKHWADAVEACRKQPDAIFIDVLQPEGKAWRALAERSR